MIGVSLGEEGQKDLKRGVEKRKMRASFSKVGYQESGKEKSQSAQENVTDNHYHRIRKNGGEGKEQVQKEDEPISGEVPPLTPIRERRVGNRRGESKTSNHFCKGCESVQGRSRLERTGEGGAGNGQDKRRSPPGTTPFQTNRKGNVKPRRLHWE